MKNDELTRSVKMLKATFLPLCKTVNRFRCVIATAALLRTTSHSKNAVLYCCHAKYTTEHRCWKCKKSVSLKYDEFSCKCGVLQAPPDDQSYFEVMDEEPKFDIDIDNLTKKFRYLQSLLHPDKFTQKSEIEQENSRLQSTLVNAAYRALKDPLQRALVLLELRGVHITEHDTITDPEFLMEILEVNEQVAEISNAQEYNKLVSQNDSVLEQLYQNLREAFSSDDIDKAKLVITKLKYFANLQEKLQEKRHLYMS